MDGETLKNASLAVCVASGAGTLTGWWLFNNAVMGLTYGCTGCLGALVVYQITRSLLHDFRFQEKVEGMQNKTITDIISYAAGFFAGTAGTWAFLTTYSKTIAFPAAVFLNASTIGVASALMVVAVTGDSIIAGITNLCTGR